MHAPIEAGRLQLLRRAAVLLESRLSIQQQRLQVVQGPNILDAVGEWGLMPGVLSVYSRHSGMLLARSKAGAPDTLDIPGSSINAERGNVRRFVYQCFMDDEERLAALQVAAARFALAANPLAIELPDREAGRHVGSHLEASWVWPGLVRVVCRVRGEVLVASVPGRPAVPAAEFVR